ncbi:MAG: hypothetical protein JGK30_07845 [Microcoleus sp. PH2017_40_RAT_O_B]|uniref:hypothetical protein n=1 Tax=unclassified Microcoleus TaxID=2642155 RepID=UPI001DEC4652|nr:MULTISPECIES: hypothetical protein [unclassified Microcoleus]MCC3508305.1 hypothetical protein [Microcoleus sp. PH2017_17_BER_D_A]TAE66780.1 MAG: hypothetical protein EAZ86_19275 [Oscillatoriales cyanobacterium]MCC3572171.1 hypothetical protein [Microcoleus sp. PH2017_34_RAT_O_A]MCC3609414.1 hypothetical protein [Microcoleus sp. PH2017_40_RAT_O_B]TAG60299.1 MAG: hypothetical protein EAZ28_07925 [Oscillatoriales cyanobacterium]
MNKTTFDKIRENSATLHKIYGNGKYENYELFDEPFKLAIEVLTWQQLDNQVLADKIGIHVQTVKQIKTALGIS